MGQLSTTHAVLQMDFSSYSSAVLWSLQFRHYTITPFAPLFRRIPPGSQSGDALLRAAYGALYILGQLHVEASSAKPFPHRAIECYGNRPLVPFPVLVPQAVNPDLIARYDLIRMLWQFQSYPIILADKGLMEMSQSLLDRFVAISMPDRPLTCKVPPGRTQRRRASFSAVQEVRAKPRPSYRQPCHCDRRLFVL
ncbi:hypothetical protein DAEQUDRAFT_279559 [Daedalea quercina L-15889]|uniref:Uncharacterized protein n=1 Tax=Daedalea quercina L-15889 TaxID=1314783 RepID=A0A165Q8G4_9APHY|nr:hypothetical protein DAEQUDRAFT_279559 [Daedalea quercina L-15889]